MIECVLVLPMANQTGPVVLFESNMEKYFLTAIYKIYHVNYLSKLYNSLKMSRDCMYNEFYF